MSILPSSRGALSKNEKMRINLRICSYLACVHWVMDARGKFGEQVKCVRLARGTATLAFRVLSKLPMWIHNSIYAQLKAWANSFILERQQGSARRSFLLKTLTTHTQSKQTTILAGQKHATFIPLYCPHNQ